jgi:DNA-binding transcriptional MerR regulator
MADQPTTERELPDKLFFRIGEAADVVGVETHVFCYWEIEFRLKPKRSASGQRMYRREDLSQFLVIRRLLHDDGFTIAGARKMLTTGDASPTQDVEHSGQLGERVARLRTAISTARQHLDESGIAAFTNQR